MQNHQREGQTKVVAKATRKRRKENYNVEQANIFICKIRDCLNP